MILLFIFILFVTIRKIEIFPIKYNNDYLSKNNTAFIKGIFILLIFFSHISSYTNFNSLYDNIFLTFRNILGQYVVALFLFYSGYGIYESIKIKKEDYIENFPKKRILKTFLNFSIAIFSFMILNYFLNIKFSLIDNILAFTGWTGIGNSNWYMFAIFCLYIITFIAFSAFPKEPKKALLIVISMSFAYIFWVSKLRYFHWGDTALCFSSGILYSLYKDNIEKNLFHDNKKYFAIFLSIFAVFTVLYTYSTNIYIRNISSVLFALMVVIITMKIKVNSKFINWLGDNLFWVYILQRIPMILFMNLGLMNYDKYLYLIVCFICTIILSFIYSKISKKTINKMIK